MSTKVLGFPESPSWIPRPIPLLPWNRLRIGLTIASVNALISVLNASATMSPIAITTT